MSEIKRNGHGAMDMTQGSPTRLIVLFSLPLLAGNVLQQLYNMVDSVVVGNYVGSSALTAVGAGFSIMFLISSLFLGFSMGATIMIAQYVGAGDQGAVGRTVDTIYSALLVILFAGVPFLSVDINTITYDSQRTKQCGWSVVQPGDSGYAPLINELSGQSASVPVWWYFTHALGKGITSAAVAVLPWKPDLRQLRFEVQHTLIADPALAQELQDFVNDCYGPSRTRLKRLGSDISEEQSREVDWVGSSFYLSTPGYYDHDHSRSPRAAWPYDASRDDGLSDTGGGGYPACKEWWSDGDAGLKNRLLKQVDTTLWQRLQKLGQSKEEYEEAVLRSLVSPRNMQVSQGGLVYNGFGGSAIISARRSCSAASAGSSARGFPATPCFRRLITSARRCRWCRRSSKWRW